MSDFPRSANRERADYETGVLDYRIAPDRFFAFYDGTERARQTLFARVRGKKCGAQRMWKEIDVYTPIPRPLSPRDD